MPPTQPPGPIIEKLWQRINERGDFPMLSNSLRATISAMKSDSYDFTALVQLVLSDFTLTQRVIRLANSAMYMAFGGNITTVSRALMVLGMEAVAHLVLGLKLVDHFHQTGTQRIDAKLELNRAMLAGCIARKITETLDARASEEAVVCTLMRQLGKLLCLFYLETEWKQIHQRADAEGRSEDEVGLDVLGISFDTLGQLAAERWGLPESVTLGMLPYDPKAEDVPARTHWMQAVTSFATSMSEHLSTGEDPKVTEQAIRSTVTEYSGALLLDAGKLLHLTRSLTQENASKRFIEEIYELRAQSSSAANDAIAAERHIRDGLADLRSLPSENRLAPVLAMASETLLASLKLSRAIVFVRDAAAGIYAARLGFGADLERLLPKLRFHEAFEVDVFHLAIANSVGIFFENARDPKFSAHIPAWFRRALPDAHAFVLLPVRTQAGAVALIYGDWNRLEAVRKVLPEEMAALNELSAELGRFFGQAQPNQPAAVR